MHATRKVLSSPHLLFGQPKLILPPATLLETLSAACQGVWRVLTDQNARDAYETAVQTQVLRDSVLAAANEGSIMTYALFHNLQNPFLIKYDVDMKKFIEAVGPALEQFHDTIGKLRNRLPQTLEKEVSSSNGKDPVLLSDQETEKRQDVINRAENLTRALLGVNEWRRQGREDENSLAGRLMKMTTDVCLDAFYYSAKFDVLSRPPPFNYVEGSSSVVDVVLLNARAREIEPDEIEPYDEFKATDAPELLELPVAAQIDVLYEVTHTYKQNAQSEKESGIGDNANSSSHDEESTSTDTTAPTLAVKEGESSSPLDDGGETVSHTNIVVAVFEGWLHRGPGGKDAPLRWKIAMLREALEFPHQPTVVRRH